MTYYDELEARTDPTPRVRHVSGPFTDGGLKTVADAILFCEENGLNPKDVQLAHNYVKWDRLETPEEISARIEAAHTAQRKHVNFIQKAHADYVDRGLIPRKED